MFQTIIEAEKKRYADFLIESRRVAEEIDIESRDAVTRNLTVKTASRKSKNIQTA